MRTRKSSRATGIALLLAALGPPAAEAVIGIGARFGDVILEGIQPGNTYDLKELAHLPFGIENRGDVDMDVAVEFERPKKQSLAENYEAIPDLSWIKANPEKMRIPPKGIGYFDLLLTVPDDPKLIGRHFQVEVDAVGTGMGLYGVATENRIRFSVGPGPESLQAEKKKKAMRQLDFDVTPHTLYLTDVPVGKAWDSRNEGHKTIRVANYARDPLDVQLSLAPWDASVSMPEGYGPIPDLSWIKLKSSTVSVAADAIGQGSFVLNVPDAPENRGRRWAVLVKTGLVGGFWLDAPVKVLVETKP